MLFKLPTERCSRPGYTRLASGFLLAKAGHIDGHLVDETKQATRAPLRNITFPIIRSAHSPRPWQFGRVGALMLFTSRGMNSIPTALPSIAKDSLAQGGLKCRHVHSRLIRAAAQKAAASTSVAVQVQDSRGPGSPLRAPCGRSASCSPHIAVS